MQCGVCLPSYSKHEQSKLGRAKQFLVPWFLGCLGTFTLGPTLPTHVPGFNDTDIMIICPIIRLITQDHLVSSASRHPNQHQTCGHFYTVVHGLMPSFNSTGHRDRPWTSVAVSNS